MVDLKSCKQCKHLTGRWCQQSTKRQREWNPYTEQWEVTLTVWPTTAFDNRIKGKCGPDRKLYEPRFRTKLWNWIRSKL